MSGKGVSGSVLESKCATLFANIGWDVVQQGRMSGSGFIPDITLSYHGKVYGYVEVVGDMDFRILKRKKEWLARFLEEEKPKLFVLTNGESFDVFYNGKYAATQTVPPSPEGINAWGRITEYYKKIQEVIKKDE